MLLSLIYVYFSPRCAESLQLFGRNSSQRCPIFDMIEFQPETYKVWHKMKSLYSSCLLYTTFLCHIVYLLSSKPSGLSTYWIAVWGNLMMTTTLPTTMWVQIAPLKHLINNLAGKRFNDFLCGVDWIRFLMAPSSPWSDTVICRDHLSATSCSQCKLPSRNFSKICNFCEAECKLSSIFDIYQQLKTAMEVSVTLSKPNSYLVKGVRRTYSCSRSSPPFCSRLAVWDMRRWFCRPNVKSKCAIICQFISSLLFLQAMVQYNRIELLNHPVCKKYLRMKWCVIEPIFNSDMLELFSIIKKHWFTFEDLFGVNDYFNNIDVLFLCFHQQDCIWEHGSSA